MEALDFATPRGPLVLRGDYFPDHYPLVQKLPSSFTISATSMTITLPTTSSTATASLSKEDSELGEIVLPATNYEIEHPALELGMALVVIVVAMMLGGWLLARRRKPRGVGMWPGE
jgi:hypothetical protein